MRDAETALQLYIEALDLAAICLFLRPATGLLRLCASADPARRLVDMRRDGGADAVLMLWAQGPRQARAVVDRALEQLRAARAVRPGHWLAADAETVESEIISAATVEGVRLTTPQGIREHAASVIARVDTVFADLKARGELRALNRAYREHRTNACDKRSKVRTYAQWMTDYRMNILREVALTEKILGGQTSRIEKVTLSQTPM